MGPTIQYHCCSYLEPVVTKVLQVEPSEDLKNTHTYNEKKVSKSPKRYT
ncbi:unnamed protein product [Ectocarpus sp. CCAP 1310/34]|nr:unnamed protein product [Ectocarpus sp. CCAP 1310/34]